MGQETKKNSYNDQDLVDFNNRLIAETSFLVEKLKSCEIKQKKIFGYEIESWIVDQNFRPKDCSESLLQSLNDPQVTPEIAKFNFEINGTPFPLDQNLYKNISTDMRNYFQKCQNQLEKLQAKHLTIGTYPNLVEQDLCMKNVYPNNRYRLLNNEILKHRQVDTHVHIRGVDIFDFHSKDIMIEAQATSLQIHIQSEFKDFKNLYNASVIASPIMAAICANSPFVCGKSLWHESRIPIFEQAISLFNRIDGQFTSRVGLGCDFIRDCPSELFLRNLQYPVLLPEKFNNEINELKYLKFHNGTIWRWNRPVLSIDENGNPNIRVEHRIPSTGPTQIDMLANMLYFLGFVHVVVDEIKSGSINLFGDIKRDLYLAAQNGVRQDITWNKKNHTIKEIVNYLEQPIINKLIDLKIEPDQSKYIVGEVIKNRVNQQRTGSSWQMKKYSETNDFEEMLKYYYENQQSNKPIYQWQGW